MAGYANVQGAREHNEDMAYACTLPAENLFSLRARGAVSLVATLDGHSGTKAVRQLHAFWGRQAKDWATQRPSLGVPLSSRQIMQRMTDALSDASAELACEPTGVVCVASLIMPTGVCFGWIGDCEACVFRPCDGGICRLYGCESVDLAKDKLLGPSKTPAFMPSFYSIGGSVHGRTLATTLPHSLLGSNPVLNVEDGEEDTPTKRGSQRRKAATAALLSTLKMWAQGGGHEDPPAGSSSVERFLMGTVNALGFWEKAAQCEYDLACVQAKNPRLLVDIAFLILGDKTLLLDARFSQAVQPTRALGDCHMTQRFGTMRQPSAMWIPLPADVEPYYVLQCSDGVFADGAFTDMDALACWMTAPLRFLRDSFYRHGHPLTERLRMAGRLPNAVEWQQAAATWPGVLRFLETRHLPEVCGDAFISTFRWSRIPMKKEAMMELPTVAKTGAMPLKATPDEAGRAMLRPHDGPVEAGFARWLTACAESVAWLRAHTPVHEPSVHGGDPLAIVAEAAARMAILMGSSDNVTVLVMKVPLQSTAPSWPAAAPPAHAVSARGSARAPPPPPP